MKFAFDYQFSIEYESIDSFLFLPSKAYILRSLYSHQRFVLLQILYQGSLFFFSFYYMIQNYFFSGFFVIRSASFNALCSICVQVYNTY